MYANSMLIILPNDMSCCWQERAQGKEGRKEMEVQKESKYSCLVLKTCMCSDRLFYCIFVAVHCFEL